MIQRNDPCWCNSGLKWKKCHYPLTGSLKPSAKQYLEDYGIILKTPEQIDKVRKSCIVTAKILDALCKAAKAGVTTNDLDRLSIRLHKEANAIPADLGYGTPPYPKDDLHLAKRSDLPWDSGRPPLAGRRHPQHRRLLDRGWFLRRLQPDGGDR